ncbi:MAG TPA: hypothetical protein VFW63_03210 [Acidimicrobiales bacterium]|nr:hypothetical protein [Acidimicrobiales bacterium]
MAAVASLAAGAVHATAAGAHSEPRAAMVTFVVTALLQIGWGAWASSRSDAVVSLAGMAVNGAAVGGWLLAKTSGISFVEGLDDSEPAQFADTLCAALAVVAVAGALAALLGGASTLGRSHPVLVGVAAVAAVGLAVPGMVATGGHDHAGGHGHAETAGGHSHGAAGPPAPYDGTLPVDLGGVPGVSPEEQAAAEDLVERSIKALPAFADIPTIEAMGWHSIGDAGTGTEHFVNWPLIGDGRVLDPERPESLVFDVDPGTGERTLAAAMFMANLDDTLATVPRLGGALVQWHVHDNLCYGGEPNRWTVRSVTPPDQPCPQGTSRLSDNPVPMVHVWIRPNGCGPFAALEGVGAGQVAPGEERSCDHAHGAHGA